MAEPERLPARRKLASRWPGEWGGKITEWQHVGEERGEKEKGGNEEYCFIGDAEHGNPKIKEKVSLCR